MTGKDGERLLLLVTFVSFPVQIHCDSFKITYIFIMKNPSMSFCGLQE